MCLIAYQPPGDPAFEKDVLNNGWQGNPHGAGYMFAAGGELVIRKAFYSLKDLRKSYTADHAAHGATSAFVIHFRWATHGSRAVGNVHPHALADGKAGLVHNGMLWDFEFGAAEDSDTATFCRTVLACRSAENLLAPETCEFLATLIGVGNKFVLMSHTGDVAIVGEDQGIREGNRWYSNTGYLPPKKSAPPQWAAQWRPLSLPVGTHQPSAESEPITRGVVFDSTAEALGAWRKRFDAAPAYSHGSASLFGADDEGEPYGLPAGESVQDELDRLDKEMADAWLAGDEDRVDELAEKIDSLEAERDRWAEAEMAMARDGY